MDKITEEYYLKQCSTGNVQSGSGFSGNRYHVGNGWFGEILKHLKPALHYIGKQGWSALKSIGKDVLSGESFGDAGRKSLIATTQNVLSDATNKLEEMKKLKKQVGKGRKRKSNVKSKPNIKVKKASKKPKKRTIRRKRSNIVRKPNKSSKSKKVYKQIRKTRKVPKSFDDFFK